MHGITGNLFGHTPVRRNDRRGAADEKRYGNFTAGLPDRLAAMTCVNEANQVRPTSTVAWWTLLYEQPNPEHLPVKVDFWWRNGG